MACPFMKTRLPVVERIEFIGCSPGQVVIDLKDDAFQAKFDGIVDALIDIKLAVDPSVTFIHVIGGREIIRSLFESKRADYYGV